MTVERAAAAERAGGAVAALRVAVSVGVCSGRARELLADVGSSGAVVARNARRGLGSIDVEGAVETSGADGASRSGENSCGCSRRARDGICEAGGAVETNRARIRRRVGDRLAAGAVVTSLAISVGSGEVGDGAGLGGGASLARCVQGDTTSGRVVGARRARLRIRSSSRAVVASRADDTANAVDGSGKAGVALAPVTSRAELHGGESDASCGAVVSRWARRAAGDGSETANSADSCSRARILRGVSCSSGAVETEKAVALASVVQLDSGSRAVDARFSDVAVFASGAV